MRKITTTILLVAFITSITGTAQHHILAQEEQFSDNEAPFNYAYALPWEKGDKNNRLNRGEQSPQDRNSSLLSLGNIPLIAQGEMIKETLEDLEEESDSERGTTIMGWIYPGEPACNAQEEYQTRQIDILKPEYFTVSENSRLTLLTQATHGCNAYSKANIEDIKKHSEEQYATVSSADPSSLNIFLTRSLKDSTDIKRLVTFAVSNDITGIELDFEGFGEWDEKTYANYKNFVNELGNALHAQGKKLMIDGPAVSNQFEEDNWYVWRYEDFVSLPVDTIVVMAYDYQYDYGGGAPIAPIEWTKEVVKWTVSKFPDTSRLAIGIPSYGYQGVRNSYNLDLLTYEQIKNKPGFKTAVRDPLSQEMTWKSGKNVYYYQDSVSMQKKLQAIRDAGIDNISVWHLGGNNWF